MADTHEKLLAEIRDLIAGAIERDRIRSEARDAQIATSLQLQRAQSRLYSRVVLVGGILVAALLGWLAYVYYLCTGAMPR
jgi:F0F1-type ATP synthase assembly protein I